MSSFVSGFLSRALRAVRGRSAVTLSSCVLACGLVLACGVTIVRAQAQVEGSTSATTADEEAHRRFEAGSLAFQAGRYEDALADFRLAYRLSHRAELLYNIGQCADRLRRDAEALEAFEGFLRDAAGDSHRVEVAARVEVLRGVVAQAEAHAGETDETHDTTHDMTEEAIGSGAEEMVERRDASSGGAGVDGGAVAVLTAGGVVLVAGAVMLALGEVDRASVENVAPETPWSRIADAASRGPILEGVGIGAIALGVLGATVGAVMLASTGAGGERHAVRVDVGPLALRVSGSLP
ncbi:MAG: tetratricopeptide repeat protein [Sandaracinaceae bacterium]|nr:tetratricopeptide repeat protein [Sandaracinaceae bacterium]